MLIHRPLKVTWCYPIIWRLIYKHTVTQRTYTVHTLQPVVQPVVQMYEVGLVKLFV